MKKLIFALLLICSLTAHAQWTLPNGSQLQWIPAASPMDWETFAFWNDGENDDYQLNLIQYGGYSGGECLNKFTPSGNNAQEYYVFFPSSNLLAHHGTLDGDFGYTTTLSPDKLTLNFTEKKSRIQRTVDSDYRGWIKVLYYGSEKQTDGIHVYLFTVDNLNTYRVLEAVEITD